ncbi:MFS transporter [Sphaerisporangium rufum]|uniref:MFS transporter n=1 Tax=Sphaerisporangium rufum TaxID=1381558 RepID=A0A919R2A1_9ACTN|nr:MFS transporter [Sphaerisporangium rufum]GII75770.1 MFS transporter [Sphaerisporangium rufum]
MLFLLAVTCGVAVGNVYFPQAGIAPVAAGFGVPPGTAALVVTAVQAGYAAGIFLLVPLGDRVPHRRLIVTLLVLTGLGLAAAAAAPGLGTLVAASAAIGVTTVVAPIAGPMAAGLVPAGRRGVVSGTLLSGSLGGMLLSRTAGGALGERLGWRVPYLVAALLTLALAALLHRALPAHRRASGDRPEPEPPRPRVVAAGRRYLALIIEPLRLLRAEPELRRSGLYQAAIFGGFSAAWTGLALLLTGPPYRLGAQALGLLALVNAVTMLCTPVAGRQVDRRGSDAVNLVTMTAVIVAAGVLLAGGAGGWAGLAALAAGTLLLDVAMQSGMVANQVRIYALPVEIHARLNTAYMVCAYLGGAAGSWLAARAHALAGWPAVCALVALLAAAVLAVHLAVTRARRRGGAGGPVAAPKVAGIE